MQYKNSRNEIISQFGRGEITANTLMEQLSVLSDSLIIDIAAQCNMADEKICIVSLGGYARRQLAPYSDLDILIIHAGELSATQKSAIESFTTSLWDSGAKPGIQLTDIDEISQNVHFDDIIRTSYIDNAYLAGYQPHYDTFCRIVLDEVVKKGKARFLSGKIRRASRAAEEYSDSIYRLEPNIKEGKGGIRDINTIWWIASVYYHIASFKELANAPFFTKESYHKFSEAAEFMFRLRAEIHCMVKRKYDILRRDLQLPIAEKWNYKDSGRYKAVENFMREYYMHAHTISEATEKAVMAVRAEIRRPGKTPTIHTLPGGIISYDNMLSLSKKDTDNVEMAGQLIKQSIARGLPIHPAAIDRIKDSISKISEEQRLKQGHILGELLGNFPNSARIAQDLLRMGIIEKFVPEFSDIICRMQYNNYHHYTVDEHTLLALSRLDEIASGQSPYSKQFREILHFSRRDLLALTVLLHDIGKGAPYASDGKTIPHSESGAEIAKTILLRLGYPQEDAETVAHVILEHLLMSQVSQRRDLNNREEIARFAEKIGTPINLDLLYLLTYADMNALGGKKFTHWNAGLLEELYKRTQTAFTQRGRPELFQESVATKKRLLIERLSSNQPLKEMVEGLGDEAIYFMPTDTLILYISMMQRLKESGEPVISVRPLPRYQCRQLMVCAKDEFGLLRKITGALTSLRCNILSANIYAPKQGTVVDTIDFSCDDELLMDTVETTVKKAILNGDIMPKIRPKSVSTENNLKKNIIKPQVVFDNLSSSVYTIVDIFSSDRLGLLYDILGVFAEHNMDVCYAKISTDVDSVVDSFSLQDADGKKITDGAILEKLKKAIYGIT